MSKKKYNNERNNVQEEVDEEVIEETSEEIEEEVYVTEEPKAKEEIKEKFEPLEEVEETPVVEEEKPELVIEDAEVPSEEHGFDFGDIQKQINELDEKRKNSRSAVEQAVLADQIKNLNRMKQPEAKPTTPIVKSNAPKRVVTGSVRTGRTTMVNL